MEKLIRPSLFLFFSSSVEDEEPRRGDGRSNEGQISTDTKHPWVDSVKKRDVGGGQGGDRGFPRLLIELRLSLRLLHTVGCQRRVEFHEGCRAGRLFVPVSAGWCASIGDTGTLIRCTGWSL